MLFFRTQITAGTFFNDPSSILSSSPGVSRAGLLRMTGFSSGYITVSDSCLAPRRQ